MKNLEIQRLRAISMFFILLGHIPLALPNILLHGYTLVSLFLVISGYLAVVQFKKKYSKMTAGKIIINELVNKAFRYIPLMWIWILIYFIIGNLVNYYGGDYGDMSRWINELKTALNLSYNYYLAELDIGGVFGQYWTLFVEIHFCIIFLILFLIFRNDRARKWISIGIILATVFVFRPLTPIKLIRYATHTQLDALFAGALIGLCCEDRTYLERFHMKQSVKTAISSILCLVLFLSGYIFDCYYNNANVKYVFFTILSALILFLARERSGWISFGKHIDRVLVWMGDMTASVYVTHILLYSCIYSNIYRYTDWIPDFLKKTAVGVCIQTIGLILLAHILGKVSLELVEKPYLNYGKRVLQKVNERL